MQKLKITLLIMTGLLAILFLIPAYVLLTFDDRDYQQLLVRSVTQFSNFTLSIDGSFKMQRSWTPVISASEINLRSKINNNQVSVQNFSIELDLHHLPSGTLLIKSLMLDDMKVDISDDIKDQNTNNTNLYKYLPIPVIEQAELANISLKTRRNEIDLVRLTIAANDQQYPLAIQGKGKFNADNFIIHGQFGPLIEIFNTSKPYPVRLKIESNQTILKLAGTIAELSKGKGMELQLTLDAREFSNLLPDHPPQLGQLSIKSKLQGSFIEPELNSIDILLFNKRSLSVHAKGSIDNLYNQQGTRVQLSGFIHDAEIINWLLPEYASTVNTLDFNAALARDTQGFILNDIDLKLATETGIKALLQGNIQLVNTSQPFRNMHIKARFDSANTEAVKPYLGDFLPEMGAVKGKATITRSETGFMLNDINILAGQGEKIQVSAQGMAGPFSSASQSLNMGLDLALNANQTADLGPMLKTELPAIGPIEIKSRLTGTPHEIKLGKITLRAGKPDLVLFKGDGEISWDILENNQTILHTDILLSSSAPSTRNAYRIIGDDMPDLGPYNASMRVHGTGNVLSGSDVQIQTGTKDTLLIDVKGRIEKIFLKNLEQKGIKLTGTISADKSSQLSRLFGNQSIPDFGTVSGKLTLQGDSKALSIPTLSLSAGQKQGLLVSAKGKVASIPLKSNVTPQGININLEATAPNTAELSAFSDTGFKIPDLGQLKMNGVLAESQGKIAINNLQITAGNPDQPMAKMYGEVQNILDRKALQIKVLFNEVLLVRLFNLKPLDRLGKIKGSLMLTNTNNSLGIKDLKILSEKSDLLSVDIHGKVGDVSLVDKISINSDIIIYDLASVGKLFDLDLPELEQISISGNIQGAKGNAAFKGSVNIGQTHLLNDLKIVSNKGIPTISGKITSKHLNLINLGFTPKDKSVEKNKRERLFSKEPIPLQMLSKVNLDLKLTMDKITGMIYPLGQTTINLALKKGHLKIAPAKINMSGGQVLMHAEILPAPLPESSLTIKSNALKIGSLTQHDQMTAPVSGNLDMMINLTGKGRSMHEIASGLKGEIALMLENGKIRKRDLDLIFMNLVSWLFSHGISEDEITISCAMANYTIVNGIARSILFIDGPKLAAKGKGTINLNKETIDTLVNIEQKKLFLNESMPIKITGRLIDPEIKLVSLSQSILKAGGYIFLPAVTIPVEVMGSFLDFVNDGKGVQSSCKEQVLHQH